MFLEILTRVRNTTAKIQQSEAYTGSERLFLHLPLRLFLCLRLSLRLCFLDDLDVFDSDLSTFSFDRRLFFTVTSFLLEQVSQFKSRGLQVWEYLNK